MPDTIGYRDSLSVLHTLEAEAGDAVDTTRPVHGLPDDVKAQFAAIQTAVQAVSAIISAGKLAVLDSTAGSKLDTLHADLVALAGYVDGLEALAGLLNGYVDGLEALATSQNGYVDGLEALATSLNGYTDGLETLLGDVKTKLDSLHTDLGTTLAGYTDGLETLITSTNTKLDTLHTDLGPATAKIGYVGSIGTGADVNFVSQALLKGMTIKNVSTAGQILYIDDTATPTSTTSYPLLPGETSPYIECTNANAINMRASASGGAAAYVGS